jgi:pentose-5-phosphate-3-epimerase
MVKVYFSLACLENPERLNQSLDSMLGIDIDGLHLDVLSRTPHGIATPFIPDCVTSIASYARTKKKDESFKIDVHILVARPQLAIRNYKRKGISGIILPGDAFSNEPRRFIRSLYEIREEAPKAKAGASYNISHISIEHALMKDLDYVIYTVSENNDVTQAALARLKELAQLKKDKKLPIEIMVEGSFRPENAYLLGMAGADVLLANYEYRNAEDCKYLLKEIKRH